MASSSSQDDVIEELRADFDSNSGVLQGMLATIQAMVKKMDKKLTRLEGDVYEVNRKVESLVVNKVLSKGESSTKQSSPRKVSSILDDLDQINKLTSNHDIGSPARQHESESECYKPPLMDMSSRIDLYQTDKPTSKHDNMTSPSGQHSDVNKETGNNDIESPSRQNAHVMEDRDHRLANQNEPKVFRRIDSKESHHLNSTEHRRDGGHNDVFDKAKRNIEQTHDRVKTLEKQLHQTGKMVDELNKNKEKQPAQCCETVYKKRSDFPTVAEYKRYLQERLRPGMMVRFTEVDHLLVQQGEVGDVVGMDDVCGEVYVAWRRVQAVMPVLYRHIEILG